jgi:hypothetical protein
MDLTLSSVKHDVEASITRKLITHQAALRAQMKDGSVLFYFILHYFPSLTFWRRTFFFKF